MANYKRASMFLNMAIILSLLLVIINLAEGKSTHNIGFQKNAALECKSVTSVASGDTCVSIAEAFQLSTKLFELINPNLVCTKLFVGQWLCVDGTAA